MRFVQNFRLKVLLGLVIGVICFTLVAGAVWQVGTIYLPSMLRSQMLGKANLLADHLLHASTYQALERGYAAAYLAANRDPFLADKVRQFRQQGDAELDKAMVLAEELLADNWGNATFNGSYERVLAARKAVAEMRRRIDAASGQPPVAPGQWVETMSALVEAGADLRLAAFTPSNDLHAAAFFNTSIKQAIWLAAEYTGRERAAIAIVLASGQPISAETSAQLQGYRGIVDRQMRYLSQTARPLLEGIESPLGEDYRKAWAAVERHYLGDFERMRAQVHAETATGNYSIDQQQWLESATAAVNTLLDFNTVVSLHSQSLTQTSADMSRFWLAMAGLVTVADLALAAGALWVIFYASRRIREPEQVMSRIREKNDLTGRLPDDGRDELSGMARAFNNMMEKLSSSPPR